METFQLNRVYLAGPMRGIHQFNFPAFYKAEERLRSWHQVAEVFNPARWDVEHKGFDPANLTGHEDLASLGFDLPKTLHHDLGIILMWAEGVVCLPGWENSSGARAEVATAHAIGKPAYLLDGESLEAIDGSLRWVSTPVHTSTPSDGDTPDGTPSSTHDDTVIHHDGYHSEVRTTSSTGGEKGVKLARFDLIPPRPLWMLAEHYGRGASKYDDHQWRRGYEFSKSFAALQRHAWAWWSGEENDPELGSHHLVAVLWHAMALLEFGIEHPAHDDRYERGEEPPGRPVITSPRSGEDGAGDES